MDCQFYVDMLNNTQEPFTQVKIKIVGKEMQCFKAV